MSKPVTEKPSNKPMTEVPIQAIKALKPKSLTDLAADIETKSDSEDSSDFFFLKSGNVYCTLISTKNNSQ